MSAKRYDVLVVGSVNADLVVRVDRRPAAGETVLGSDLATYPGGKGANQAVAAARLGAKVAFLGRTGSDGHGRLLRDALAGDGVDIESLIATPGPSGVALITVGPGGDNTIIVSPGANGRLGADDVAAAEALFAAAAVVSLQLEIPLETVLAAARAARAAGARVVLNLSPAADVPDELLARCDPLVVNEHEAAFLGATDPAGLLARGPRSVVITKGAEGAVVADGTDVVTVRSPRVDAVDTTGAGDAFIGSFATFLVEGCSEREAVARANLYAALSTTAVGTQKSFWSRDDFEREWTTRRT
jgi:ribokinase